jgi:omega-6 fatty acid desaturase (delta-12 desaturase)
VQVIGWPAYLIINASGQSRFPRPKTNHFNPNANAIFRENQAGQIIASDIGILLWIAAQAAMIYYQGTLEWFRVYFVPYLWSVPLASWDETCR